MSVLIKGMDMPLCCQQCPLCGDEGRFCMAARRCIPIVGRIDWCPLVEVPTPHGRLIDGDALHERAVERTEKKGNYHNEMQYVISPFMVLLAPTIIEAEE